VQDLARQLRDQLKKVVNELEHQHPVVQGVQAL
jgi:hypothetical protein